MKKLIAAALLGLMAVPFADAGSLAGKKIYLNPGHGGYEATTGTYIPGQFANGYRSDGSTATDRWVATIPYPTVCEEGVWESKHNLWRGLELKRLLEQAGANVMMSRTQNRPEDDRILQEIGTEATQWGADMFLSIHSNASGVNYMLTIFRSADPRPGQPFDKSAPDIPASKEMATIGWKHLHDNPLTCWQARKTLDNPYVAADSVFYGTYHLGVLRKLFVPGYLAEIAFHDYKPEAHRMLSPDYSNIVAYMLYTSICEYFDAPLPATGIVAGEVKDSQRILRDPLFLGATFGDHDQYLPLNGAKVTLTGNGVNKTYVTDNNYNGIYYFPDLAPGTYNIKVEMDGYTTYEGTAVCEAAKTRGPIVMMDDPNYDPADEQGSANVYASALEVVGGNTVRFTLNADATSVTLNLLKNGQTVKSLDLGPQAKGTNTVEIPDAGVAEGEYQWSLTARADALTGQPAQFTVNGDPLLDIANARGVAVDVNQSSPWFGRVYVTSVEGNGKKGARMGTGIYVLDAALTDVTGQGGTPYGGGQAWKGNSSPMRLNVAPDGKVWICDWADSHAGVYTMDPANPSADFVGFFGGTRNADGLAAEGGVQLNGSVADLCVLGTGADTKLYTVDEDITSFGFANVPYRYNIGTAQAPYTKAPDKCYGNFDTRLKNANVTLSHDGRGGLWVCQYRYDNNSPETPVLMHINGQTDDWDYFCGDKEIFLGSIPIGGMAASPSGKYVAVPDLAEIRIGEVTWDASGTPSVSFKYSIGSTYGSRPFTAAFDAADNLYVAYNDNGGGIGGWALPKENNEYTTVANAALPVSAGIAGNLVDETAIHYFNNTVTADGALVEVFSATGVKVAEGYRVDTSAFPAGVYVVRSGAKTLKIRK